MLDGTGGNGSLGPPSAAFSVHQQLNEANRLFQQNSYQAAAVVAGVVPPFSGHLPPGAHHNSAAALQHQHQHQQHQHQHHHHHHHHQQQQAAAAAAAAAAGNSLPCQQHNAAAAAAAAAAVAAMGPPHASLSQLQHGLSNASQSIAAALFAGPSLMGEDLKLAAAAAAAAAAAQSARGKKTHRAEPVPQSGFKGVSWNSRMKAWLAFYVTENGERKSKTFSTRKLGMEEARLQAITFCKQKQDQRRERKRARELQSHQHCGASNVSSSGGMDKVNQDTSMIDSPARQQAAAAAAAAAAMRCGYPTTPGLGMNGGNLLGPLLNGTSAANVVPQQATASGGAEISYVPIVPIAMNMIEKSGLLQPLELNELPPCQHCHKQPYPFLMIVSEGQEQTYSGSSIMSLAAHNGQTSSTVNPSPPSAAVPGSAPPPTNTTSGALGEDTSASSAAQRPGPPLHTTVTGNSSGGATNGLASPAFVKDEDGCHHPGRSSPSTASSTGGRCDESQQQSCIHSTGISPGVMHMPIRAEFRQATDNEMTTVAFQNSCCTSDACGTGQHSSSSLTTSTTRHPSRTTTSASGNNTLGLNSGAYHHHSLSDQRSSMTHSSRYPTSLGAQRDQHNTDITERQCFSALTAPGSTTVDYQLAVGATGSAIQAMSNALANTFQSFSLIEGNSVGRSSHSLAASQHLCLSRGGSSYHHHQPLTSNMTGGSSHVKLYQSQQHAMLSTPPVRSPSSSSSSFLKNTIHEVRPTFNSGASENGERDENACHATSQQSVTQTDYALSPTTTASSRNHLMLSHPLPLSTMPDSDISNSDMRSPNFAPCNAAEDTPSLRPDSKLLHFTHQNCTDTANLLEIQSHSKAAHEKPSLVGGAPTRASSLSPLSIAPSANGVVYEESTEAPVSSAYSFLHDASRTEGHHLKAKEQQPLQHTDQSSSSFQRECSHSVASSFNDDNRPHASCLVESRHGLNNTSALSTATTNTFYSSTCSSLQSHDEMSSVPNTSDTNAASSSSVSNIASHHTAFMSSEEPSDSDTLRFG